MAKISTLIFFFINISAVFMRYEKPVPQLLWQGRCDRNGIALNDCNWCWCDHHSQYACKARVCSDVDMFGHFNDAIREVDAGMGGHGVWRSTETPCEPGVHYRKSALLCVCTEDGAWPNPVCRDIFQVLHAVEVTQYSHPMENQKCAPSKLHLIGCNVCICPASGIINPNYCTDRDCNEDTTDLPKETHEHDTIDEFYATCNPDQKYKLGCRSCVCLRNNRLLCDNCTTETTKTQALRGRLSSRNRRNLCSGKELKTTFRNDCNLCYCATEDTMYCSVKKCINTEENKIAQLNMPQVEEMFTEALHKPAHLEDCIPGTYFKKKCNTCYCMLLDNGVKSFACTMKQCIKPPTTNLYGDCVVGTTYVENCLKCNCYEEHGIKRELCVKDEECAEDSSAVTKDLDSMHGYCEPLHTYMKDCNKCKCLADGKTSICTSDICPPKQLASRPIVIDILPMVREQDDCTEGRYFMDDCNHCFCMKNGNAICTQNKCKSK